MVFSGVVKQLQLSHIDAFFPAIVSAFSIYFHHTMLNAAALSITHNTPRQDTSSRSQCVRIPDCCLIPSASETERWCIFLGGHPRLRSTHRCQRIFSRLCRRF